MQNRRDNLRVTVCLERNEVPARTLTNSRGATSSLLAAITRRDTIGWLIGAIALGSVGAIRLVQAEQSISPGDAESFVRQAGAKLIAVLNGPYGGKEKRQLLRRLINANVDAYGIARFAMGRYWRVATEAQRADFVKIFPALLAGVLREALGGYPGVEFTVDRSVQHDEVVEVWTSIAIPETAPRGVGWVVGATAEGLRIIDVVAEGASLRITQRDDVATLIAQHQNSIDAMIAAMERETAID